jgi:hypothetical protein
MALPQIIDVYGNYHPHHNTDLDINNTRLYSSYLNKINNVELVEKTVQNNKRHIELNENVILKYKAQSILLKKIIIICCIALIGSFLYYLNIFPNMVYNIYLGIVFGIGFIIVMHGLFDIFKRSAHDFKQYDYEAVYRPPSIKKINKSYNTTQLANLPTVCK